MKKTIFILICILMTINLQATLTRVNSLGDIPDQSTGKISGLIKDDIVDISLNPACVNDIKSFLILTSFYLTYGDRSQPEKDVQHQADNESKKTTITETTSEITYYDLSLDTGILIPLKVFNIFFNYKPEWERYNQENVSKNTFGNTGSVLTNETVKFSHNWYQDSQIPYEITLGLDIAERVMLGLRTGYFNRKYDESERDTEGLIIRQGESEWEKMILGAGVKFNFSEKLSLGFVLDTEYIKNDESPLEMEDGIGEGDNYDPVQKVYNYSFTENLTGYSFRFIPELHLKNDKFFRCIAGTTVYDYNKNYNFTEKGILKDTKVANFDETKIEGQLGISFSHSLSETTKAVYGLNYAGIINGSLDFKKFPNKYNEDKYIKHTEEFQDNLIRAIIGFDTKVTKYLFLRTGLSQGLYRKDYWQGIDINSSTDVKTEYTEKTESYLPYTEFSLGFYIQPKTDLIFEFNFTGNKDWNMENISDKTISTKVNGEEIERESVKNYDFNLGMSVQYKI